MNLIITYILMATLTGCMAGNILVMLPLPVYSHIVNFLPVFEELANRSHNVTIVYPYPQKKSIPNLKEIVVKDIHEEMLALVPSRDLTQLNGWLFKLLGMWVIFPKLIERILQEEPIQNIIKDTTSSYDLVIAETFFGGQIFVALGHKFNAPVVNIHAHGMTPTLTFFTGNHYPTSYVPIFRFPTTDQMTFLERTRNTFYYIWETYGSYIYFLPKMDSVMRKYFVYPGSEKLPSLAELLESTSLTLAEIHTALRYPRPLQNNIIEIGGLNLRDSGRLPNDLQKYMDEAPDGVIYFSFGSHFKTTELDQNIISAIFSAFGKIKMKVLMKWEVDVPNKPANVKIGTWLPQTSLLSHPNCKLFVTHGGIHGITEGFYFGVPMVGIPLFADQMNNLKVAENFGAAYVVNLLDITEEKLLNAMKTVLSNDRYRMNAAKRKHILRDRPMSPIDEATFWIEYVLRHKGAPHLKPALIDIPLYQYLLIDVVLFFILIIFCLFTVLVVSFKMILRILEMVHRSKVKRVNPGKEKNENKAKTKPKKE